MDVLYRKAHHIPCPACGSSRLYGHPQIQSDVQNLPRRDGGLASTELYLRPETAQGIFVNFKNIQRTTRKKIPFGVGTDRQIASAMKLRRATLSSVSVNLNRWNWSSSAKPGTDLEWFAYWRKLLSRVFYLSLGIAGRKPASARS